MSDRVKHMLPAYLGYLFEPFSINLHRSENIRAASLVLPLLLARPLVVGVCLGAVNILVSPRIGLIVAECSPVTGSSSWCVRVAFGQLAPIYLPVVVH